MNREPSTKKQVVLINVIKSHVRANYLIIINRTTLRHISLTPREAPARTIGLSLCASLDHVYSHPGRGLRSHYVPHARHRSGQPASLGLVSTNKPPGATSTYPIITTPKKQQTNKTANNDAQPTRIILVWHKPSYGLRDGQPKRTDRRVPRTLKA